jgi:hypothetical protein
MGENTVTFNRRVEIMLINCEWQSIPFAELEDGAVFKLYEPDGTLVGEYLAKSDPYVDNGVWTIKVEDEQ